MQIQSNELPKLLLRTVTEVINAIVLTDAKIHAVSLKGLIKQWVRGLAHGSEFPQGSSDRLQG